MMMMMIIIIIIMIIIRTCTKISSNKSRRQSDYTVESASANCRTIPNNKADIIIRDNEKGTCMLIVVGISGDRNVIKKRPRRF
jgi:hypothetical protein